MIYLYNRQWFLRMRITKQQKIKPSSNKNTKKLSLTVMKILMILNKDVQMNSTHDAIHDTDTLLIKWDWGQIINEKVFFIIS